MRFAARRRSSFAVLGAIAIAAWGGSASSEEGAGTPSAPPAVADYALRCFTKLHLDPADLAGPFDCTKGKRLVTKIHGAVADRDQCAGSTCQTGLPTQCDLGTWLDDSCYGHSYLQVVPTPSNPKVKAALLCRHKTRWELGPAPLIDLDDNLISGFDDVAMIVHNAGNGETCWFQSPDGADEHLDGSSVPGPARVTREGEFWMTPTATRNVNCVHCHDSGPWMSSPWIYTQAGEDLGLEVQTNIHHPYKSSTPPFNTWPEPRFAKLDDDTTCTSCHHIAAAKLDVSRTSSLAGPNFRTCTEWLDRTTSGTAHPMATSPEGHADDLVYWMPLGHGLSAADWETTHRGAVDRIKECCLAIGTKPMGEWPEHCVEDMPEPSCPVADVADADCPVPIEF